jgi:hypothetical protein
MNADEHRSQTLPASEFPERAEWYVCDNCGRDITRHLHPGRAHMTQAMGPVRYVCRCGERWLTGAVEWDHMDDWYRHRRFIDLRIGIVLFSVPSFLLGLLVYFAFGRSRSAIIAGVTIGALPAALQLVQFAVEVGASVWRTRMSR